MAGVAVVGGEVVVAAPWHQDCGLIGLRMKALV